MVLLRFLLVAFLVRFGGESPCFLFSLLLVFLRNGSEVFLELLSAGVLILLRSVVSFEEKAVLFLEQGRVD